MPRPLRGVIPREEGARLAAVRRYAVLDTPPDGAFDRVAALAARFCGVPISTISIVDEDRIWFKSATGLAGVEQVDREPGLCASAILGEVPYVVTDASIDPRTMSNPLVCGELGLRFYVAVPLRTSDGHNLGTLNIIDRRPREVSAEELATLADLAAIVMDELELRLAARRTVELEALRTAAEFRDTIVAGISHEMRTPLAVLHGITGLAFDAEAGVEQNERLQDLFRRQVGHLDRLVEQFLDFATLEHGQMPTVAPAPVELRAILETAVELHADRRGVQLTVPDGLPPALVDHARTLHIVCELIRNAIRFSPPDAPVKVWAEPGEERTLRIIVEDRGRGIPPDALPHLFTKFYRSPDSTGSGLGLFVASALADAQQATMEVEPAPDSGSRFTLVVPRASRSGAR